MGAHLPHHQLTVFNNSSVHLFGRGCQGTIHISLGIKIKNPFNHLVVLRKQFLVHLLPVFPEGIDIVSSHGSFFGLFFRFTGIFSHQHGNQNGHIHGTENG